jgi:hypothetical protein
LFVLLAGFALYLLLRVNALKKDIEALYKRTEYLNDRLKGEPPATPKPEVKAAPPQATPTPAPTPQPVAKPVAPPPPEPKPAPPEPLPQPPRPRTPEPVGATEWKATQATAAEAKTAPASPPPPPPKKPRPTISWEQQIGARLPVWIGGIALALSGIFLVKYSIDTGLLSPAVRCVLAGLLGLAMLAGAQWVIARKTVANGERIAQALAGAGIAVLYGTLFASGTVYQFFPSSFTFGAMAALTAVAVLLSLRHGPAIAMLGMVGGFLTPVLVGASDPNPAVLFTYLTALSVGLFVVIRRENWWWLAWPIVIACYAWVLIWLAGNGTPGDSVWVGLFLIAVCAISMGFMSPAKDGAERAPFAWVGLLATAAIAVAFMTFVVIRGDFGIGEWRLYGLLTIGAIILAALDQERYRFLPWITIAPVAALLGVWQTGDTETFIFVLVSFAALFTVAGIFMIGRARHPMEWGFLACAAMLGFYLLAYARLYDVIDAARILAPGEPVGSWPVWGIVATALATIATLVAGRIAETKPGGRSGVEARAHLQLMLAQFALTAIALMTAGLLIEVPIDDLPIAILGLLVTVMFMDWRTDITALRPATYALTGLAFFLILPQFAPFIVYAVRVFAGAPLPDEMAIPVTLTTPLVYLGAPALLLVAASWLGRRRRDDLFVRTIESAVVVLIAMIGYVFMRRAGMPLDKILTTVTPSDLGAIISQSLLVYGIALIAVGQQVKRDTLIGAGIVAGIIAIARVIHFDIQPAQLLSVWVPMAFGEVSNTIRSLPIASWPVFHLGAPAALLVCLRLMLGIKRDDWIARLSEYVAVVFIGLMGYFLIRHAFNPAADVLTAAGSRLEGGVISLAQIVYAIALIVAGRFFGRASLMHAAAVSAAIAIARIVFFDIKLPLLAFVTVQLSLDRLVDPSLTSPAAAAPLFHLALPALLLAALAFVAREEMKGWLARVCEYTVVAFAGLMTYYLIRHAFNAPEDVFAGSGTYLERGILTNAFLIVGAAAYIAGSRLGREALRIGGAIAATFAAVRLGFFDILVSSPLVKPHDVGSWPIINALLLPYAIPVVWLLAATIALKRRGLTQVVPTVHAGAMLLVFAWVSLNVRQIFQGPILNNPGLAGDSEVYAYSIAWLILGIGLLVAGTWRHDKLIRFASLAVMVLTVGKVFLYDASELTGLFRVLSFLGLGLSLLGLSWFYTRYVFALGKPAQEET